MAAPTATGSTAPTLRMCEWGVTSHAPLHALQQERTTLLPMLLIESQQLEA